MEKTNTTPKDGYPLQRSFLASVRLYYQYWMIRRQLGYLLHPAVPVKEDAVIADVACGTSIWALDVAKRYPSAALQGFDISTEQYPHSHWLPRNVSLGTLDLFKPIPAHLRGKYDIVHVAVVVAIVENSDPSAFLSNVLLLLKPGGHLQWDDIDLGAIYTETPDPIASPCEALNAIATELVPRMLKSSKESFHWVQELDKTFERREMAVLEFVNVPPSNELALPWTYNMMMACGELIRQMTPEPQAAKEWWDVLAKAAEEVTRGATAKTRIISAVGQKPS